MKKLLSLVFLLMALNVSAQSRYSDYSFDDLNDIFRFINPSKSFYGSGPVFEGNIEIRCENSSQGAFLKMYVNGAPLSMVGWSNPYTAAKGKYAKLLVQTDYRQAAVILHLPDDAHSKPYLYFLPEETATDANLAKAFNIPVTAGWEWYEPDVQGGRGVLILHTDSKTKPTPIVYEMR